MTLTRRKNLRTPSPSILARRLMGGATRMEALACGVAILFLGLLSIPTLGGFRSGGDRQWCHANFRQLTRAWLSYAEDNAGRVPPNSEDDRYLEKTNRTWIVGLMIPTGLTSANTNTLVLRDSLLGRYLPSVSVYRCPADSSLSHGLTGTPRVRSIAMNSYMGERLDPWRSGYRQFRTLYSIVDPRPSECFVFIDEREDCIVDGAFYVDMLGYDTRQPRGYSWVELPSFRHDGGASLSFADGHVEVWKWADARTVPPYVPGVFGPVFFKSAGNVDVARIQSATTRPMR